MPGNANLSGLTRNGLISSSLFSTCQKHYPDFAQDQIEEFLIGWIEAGYDPENYSQGQLDELDRLTEQWIVDHMRQSKTSKKGKRTRHS